MHNALAFTASGVPLGILSQNIWARRDRKLIPEESEGWETMIEAFAAAPVLGSLEVAVPGCGKRKARTAEIELRVVQATIQPPRRRGHARDGGSIELITVQVIGATENGPPQGAEAVSWVLLTNLRVTDFEAAREKLQWYARRWGIDTWHWVLKSGWRAEECLLQTGERVARYVARYLTVFSIVGVRLMHVAYLARVQPDLPSTEVFSKAEIEALHVRVHKMLPPAKAPTLKEMVRLLGRVGEHLGRKCDGEPGMAVLWRGWMRLYEGVLLLRAHQQALGLADSS